MVEPVSSNSADGEPEQPDDGEQDGNSERAANARRKGDDGKQRSFWKELPILIAVALVLAFLIQQFIGRVFMIPSGSMEDTLLVGDRILVDKITYNFSEPEPGDVVVFKGPQSWVPQGQVDDSANGFVDFMQSIGSVFGLAPPDEKDFVKRVVATEGQRVSCCSEQGHLKVNGEPLDEPYLYWPPAVKHTQKEFPPVTVPTGAVWVMGDNRRNSCASVCQGGNNPAEVTPEGAVPVENVIGEARVVVLPPSSWSLIDDSNPQATGQAAVATSAPAWQQGMPLAAGAVGAWPVVALGHRLTGRLRSPRGPRGRSGE